MRYRVFLNPLELLSYISWGCCRFCAGNLISWWMVFAYLASYTVIAWIDGDTKSSLLTSNVTLYQNRLNLLLLTCHNKYRKSEEIWLRKKEETHLFSASLSFFSDRATELRSTYPVWWNHLCRCSEHLDAWQWPTSVSSKEKSTQWKHFTRNWVLASCNKFPDIRGVYHISCGLIILVLVGSNRVIS